MENKTAIALGLRDLIIRVRQDVTATKDQRGRPFWTKEALTYKMLEAHVSDEKIRGVCPIKAGESQTRVGLLDLDSHKGETSWDQMIEVAREISEMAYLLYGLKACAFSSTGGKGIHLYFLWKTPQDAKSVRKLLAELLSSLGLNNGTKGVAAGEIEIFPKQDNVPIDGFGNQFFLPLHGKSRPLDLIKNNIHEKEAIINMLWPMSADVPVSELSCKTQQKKIPTGNLKIYEGALSAIDPNCGYEEWLRIGMGIHFESEGSDEGFYLWDEWSSNGDTYTCTEDLRYKWESFGGKDKNVTGKTILAVAVAKGYTGHLLDDFPNLNDVDCPKGAPVFETTEQGKFKATDLNVRLALSYPNFTGLDLKYDLFRDEIVIHDLATGVERPVQDTDNFELRVRLAQKGFCQINRELMRDAIADKAYKSQFDSAQQWLDTVPPWDGVSRVCGFFASYFGAVAGEYPTAVGEYLWTGFVGRIVSPGCKADMVPVLVSGQGTGKSTSVSELVSTSAHFCEFSFSEKEDDIARKLRGCLVAEISELRGLRTKAQESIKAFITRREEKWTPKFKEYITKFHRRVMMIGTTNEREFLDDATGNRRWLPIEVFLIDIDQLKEDKLQLWAEAKVLFQVHGVMWKRAEALSLAQHQKYSFVDDWEHTIIAYIEACKKANAGDEPKLILPKDIYFEALFLQPKDQTRAVQLRVGNVMRSLGYESTTGLVDGKKTRGFSKKGGT